MTSAVLRSAQAGAILTAVGLSVGLMTGVAEAAPPSEHNCPSPFFSDGLNARYNVNERIIGPPQCRYAFAGEKWVRGIPPWLTAKDVASAVYPPDDPSTPENDPYTPANPDPIKDFELKFDGVRYVTDEGTPQAKTVELVGQDAKNLLFKSTVRADTPNPAWANSPLIVPVSPVFQPLSVTNDCKANDTHTGVVDASQCHTNTVYVHMSAKHCNGRPPGTVNDTPGLNPGVRCLEKDWSKYPISDPGPFTFQPPSRPIPPPPLGTATG